jgi:hypothetical protein
MHAVMSEKRYPPKPYDSRAEPPDEIPDSEPSAPGGPGIERFEDMNPRQLALATAYLVQATQIETARVAAEQEAQARAIIALVQEQRHQARTQARQKDRLDAIEQRRPSLSIAPGVGEPSDSGLHILTTTEKAMVQQNQYQIAQRKASWFDRIFSGGGAFVLGLLIALLIVASVWITHALTLAATLSK